MEAYTPGMRREKVGTGIPRYMATFADLMTLLLCFFVLLVTMAEIDALKFKMIVRSMENAFGVERPEPKEIEPKATSIIQQEFSPSLRESVPSPHVTQATDTDKELLVTEDPALYRAAKLNRIKQQLEETFSEALDAKLISLETLDDRVLIRIDEQASFASGNATLKQSFTPLLGRIGEALKEIDAMFVIAGHTDNIPLSSGLYRSNWELAAARASSVVHALLTIPGLEPEQFRIEAYADTEPLMENDTESGRAQNRRVEIGIITP